MREKSLLQLAKAAKDQAEAMKADPEKQAEYLQKMVEHHSLMADHWDNKVGSVYNDDDKCTKKWEYHCNMQDKFFRQLNSLK